MNSYLAKTDAFIASLGFEAYRVGGSVRDEILGRRVKDADYMVRGVSLDKLVAACMKAISGGGTTSRIKDRMGRPLGVRVSKKGLGVVEITLPRKEISTGPGHRDFDIVLDPMLPLHEDATRRDFTFNALYKQVHCVDGAVGGVVADPTARGLYDLQHRLVQTTYRDSFRDDPLRILRAARFVSTLGYDITLDTREQMFEYASSVTGLLATGNMSGTVFDEMSKILMGSDVAKALRLLAQNRVLGMLLPGLSPMIGFNQRSKYHDMTTDEHTFHALATAAKVDAPLRVRWALLFHDSGKPLVAWKGEDGRLHYYATDEAEDHEAAGERIWRAEAARMGVPARLREDVATLIREHMIQANGKVKPTKVRRARVRLGDEMLRDLHMHRMCDLSGKGNSNRLHLLTVARQEDIRRQAEAAGIPKSVNDLEITGHDCMDAGLSGADIGAALRTVLDEVVCQPDSLRLSREWQLKRIEFRPPGAPE